MPDEARDVNDSAAQDNITATKQTVQKDSKPFFFYALAFLNIAALLAIAGLMWYSKQIDMQKRGPKDIVEGYVIEDSAQIAEQQAQRPIFPLEDFTVNLVGKRGESNYLRASIELEVDNAEVESEIELRRPQLMDVIIILLSSKTVADVGSRDGKQRVKEEIKQQINHFLTKGKVRDVYFTQFMVDQGN